MPANVIVISGTPGTGKTTIANRLAEYEYLTINLFDFAVKYSCIEGMDSERDSIIIDTDKLHDVLDNYLGVGFGVVIIESHYGDIVPDKYVKRAFVLSAPIPELRKRLSSRGYSKEKIDENVESELFQICWTDCLENFGTRKVVKIENTNIEETVHIIKSFIQNYLV